MLGRWLSGAGCVVMCSVAVWAGCSSDDVAVTPANDAGATGNDSGGGGGDGGGGGNGDGGGGGFEDSGPAVPNVTIKYGSCPAFTPCGGDVTGKWTVSGGCLSETAFAAAKQPPCQGVTESDVVIKAGGTVQANATTVQRKTAVSLTAKLAIPAACAAQAGGQCALVQAGLTTAIGANPAFFDTATCTSDGSNGCNCDVAKTVAETTNDQYVVTGNTLTTTTPPARTFDFCVAGNKNNYTETTDGGLPVVIEISK